MAADYTKPGNDGGAKPRKPHHKVDVAFPVPNPPACGKVYIVRFRTQQRVGACDQLDVDYDGLYKRADDVAQMRVGKIDCTTLVACPQTNVQRTASWWGCDNGLAYAEVVYTAYCTAAGGPLKDLTKAEAPTPDDLIRPKDKPEKELEDLDAAGAHEERIVESIPKGGDIGGIFLACPGTQTFVYTYHEVVKKCPPASFKRYVTAAETAAKSYSEAFICELLGLFACTQSTTILRREWDCVDHGFPLLLFHEVVVRLYIEISCKNP